MGTAIRRQVDIRDDVISLARLIDDVWRYPTALTKARYFEMHEDMDEHLESMAEGWYRDMAGEGDFINPEIPAADMQTLRAETKVVRDWVNSAVAHYSQKEKKFSGSVAPPLSQIHSSLDCIAKLFRKYQSLLNGFGVADPIMPFWQASFRVPWIADAAAYGKLVKEGEGPPPE
jgi:hypothetical protein